MKRIIEKSDFSFLTAGHGHYRVSYTSPSTYKRWSALITDMELIDATKNCDHPKRKDLEILKSKVKTNAIKNEAE